MNSGYFTSRAGYKIKRPSKAVAVNGILGGEGVPSITDSKVYLVIDLVEN